MNLIEKYLGEDKQEKVVNDMKKKGWKIVMWDSDFVGMVNIKTGDPAEVYPNGNVKYPKRIYPKTK
jgi:hypothetical protein